MLPEATFRHYHYVLRIKVVTEGAVIKVDFVEGLGGESDHLALVEAPILVFADDLLARRDAQQGSFSTLKGTAWVSLDRTDSVNKLPYGGWRNKCGKGKTEIDGRQNRPFQTPTFQRQATHMSSELQAN